MREKGEREGVGGRSGREGVGGKEWEGRCGREGVGGKVWEGRSGREGVGGKEEEQGRRKERRMARHVYTTLVHVKEAKNLP